jgi:tRNA-specific 2-thiouridylase
VTKPISQTDRNTQGKVLVAMSGGVDSSVAACLLQQAGYDVTGVTLELLANPEDRTCNGETLSVAARDAAKVAERLGIQHFVAHMEDLFREKVIDPFFAQYLKGKTPNPCVRCNKTIKFGALMQIADDRGFAYLATGHYANIIYSEEEGEYQLLTSAGTKDQSYVLYGLNQNQLARVLFPVADLEKEKLREIARSVGLPVADKPDSQDICFIKDMKYTDFIENSMKNCCPEGDFTDRDGNVLGKHRGLIYYTVGQRKGIGIAYETPLYVLALDTQRNRVILGSEQELYTDTMRVNDYHFISEKPPVFPFRAEVKIRYSTKAVPATISLFGEDVLQVAFDEPVRAITPGQTAVLYQGRRVIGGGEIDLPFDSTMESKTERTQKIMEVDI